VAFTVSLPIGPHLQMSVPNCVTAARRGLGHVLVLSRQKGKGVLLLKSPKPRCTPGYSKAVRPLCLALDVVLARQP
jgi:hypothetical protein